MKKTKKHKHLSGTKFVNLIYLQFRKKKLTQCTHYCKEQQEYHV